MPIDDLEIVAYRDAPTVMVVHATSAATRYDIVLTRLDTFPLAGNQWVIALVNLGGHVWNLPKLTGWHPSYLAQGRHDLNDVTARTIVAILAAAAALWDAEP